MTPAESAGITKGKYFKCTQAYDDATTDYQQVSFHSYQDNGKIIGSGAIITLYEDDNTSAPLFRVVEGECSCQHADGNPGCFENFPLHPEWLEELPDYKEEE